MNLGRIMELPFQEAQRVFNSLYYQQGGRYALDFSTHASNGSRLAYSEADEFYSHYSKKFEKREMHEVRVLELGCGNGNNAWRFLERIKQLDARQGAGLLERVHYTLADFSPQMLADARENKHLKNHLDKLAFSHFNAETMNFKSDGFHLIRANELFDDLPTQLVVIDEGVSNEIWLELYLDEKVKIKRRDGSPVSLSEFAWLARGRYHTGLSTVEGSFVKKLELEVKRKPVKLDSTAFTLLHSTLGRIPPGAVIPIPFSAASCISHALPHLAPGGVFDAFDYGFNSLKELEGLQPAIFRTPGALTTFVNFPFLKKMASIFGYKTASVEPQQEFTGGSKKELAGFYHLRLSV